MADELIGLQAMSSATEHWRARLKYVQPLTGWRELASQSVFRQLIVPDEPRKQRRCVMMWRESCTLYPVLLMYKNILNENLNMRKYSKMLGIICSNYIPLTSY